MIEPPKKRECTFDIVYKNNPLTIGILKIIRQSVDKGLFK